MDQLLQDITGDGEAAEVGPEEGMEDTPKKSLMKKPSASLQKKPSMKPSVVPSMKRPASSLGVKGNVAKKPAKQEQVSACYFAAVIL
eukprot:15469677-Alexandrium_andersonii.AAC.1